MNRHSENLNEIKKAFAKAFVRKRSSVGLKAVQIVAKAFKRKSPMKPMNSGLKFKPIERFRGADCALCCFLRADTRGRPFSLLPLTGKVRGKRKGNRGKDDPLTPWISAGRIAFGVGLWAPSAPSPSPNAFASAAGGCDPRNRR
jgi:hypothetical protein